jgi:hypothetical protein
LNAFLQEGQKKEEVKDQEYEFKIDDDMDTEVINKATVHNEAVSDDEAEEELKISNDPVIA